VTWRRNSGDWSIAIDRAVNASRLEIRPHVKETTMTRAHGKLAVLAALLIGSLAGAARGQRPVIYADAEKAGADFLIQGEYEGSLPGQEKLAAQVVAEGNGKFAVVFLPGGLPGAGWDGKTRIKAKAATANGKTAVAGGWTGSIADGKLDGVTADGKAFTLRRTIRKSPTLGGRPPRGAVVLFDGSNADGWETAVRSGSFKGLLVEDKEGKVLYQGAVSKKAFGDTKLHLEFRMPFVPAGRGQDRANSGV
jgi:hypothetical protein